MSVLRDSEWGLLTFTGVICRASVGLRSQRSEVSRPLGRDSFGAPGRKAGCRVLVRLLPTSAKHVLHDSIVSVMPREKGQMEAEISEFYSPVLFPQSPCSTLKP